MDLPRGSGRPYPMSRFHTCAGRGGADLSGAGPRPSARVPPLARLASQGWGGVSGPGV